MAGLSQQIRSVVGNGLLRPGADDGYADGDDGSWQAIDWPGLTRGVEVLGRPVNLIDTGADGDGRPVVLLVHGLGGCWQNWLLTIPALMDRMRVVAIDLPGFGASPLPAEPISIRGYGRILDALCDAMGIDGPVVVGNSMGGFVGAELALAFPTRVARLALVSAAGLSVEFERREPTLTAARLWSHVSPRVQFLRSPVVRRPRLRRLAMQGVLRYPERLSAPLAWELLGGTGKPGLVPALDALMRYPIRDRLERIAVPTLIVWGRNDMTVPVADAAEFERLIGANARTVILEDTGHLPMLERPGVFNPILADFVTGADALSG